MKITEVNTIDINWTTGEIQRYYCSDSMRIIWNNNARKGNRGPKNLRRFSYKLGRHD